MRLPPLFVYWPGLHGSGSGADRTVVVLCSRGFRGKANIRDLGCIVVGIVVAPEDRNSHGMTAVAQGFAIDILRFRGSGCVQRGKGSTRDVPAVRFRYHREVLEYAFASGLRHAFVLALYRALGCVLVRMSVQELVLVYALGRLHKHRGWVVFLGLGLLCYTPVAFLFQPLFLDHLTLSSPSRSRRTFRILV